MTSWPFMTFTYIRSYTVICFFPLCSSGQWGPNRNLRWSDIHTVREKSATWHLLITNLDTSRNAGSSTLSSFFLIPYYLSLTFYYLSPTPYSHLSHFSHLTLSFTLYCPFLTLYSLYLTRYTISLTPIYLSLNNSLLYISQTLTICFLILTLYLALLIPYRSLLIFYLSILTLYNLLFQPNVHKLSLVSFALVNSLFPVSLTLVITPRL